MSRQLFLSLLLSAPFLVSCGNDDSLTPEREPMTFSVPQTRATLSSLYDNFKVPSPMPPLPMSWMATE